MCGRFTQRLSWEELHRLADLVGQPEPPRVCRRPQLLRGWGHGSEEEDVQQIFT